jgi:hypothetical protein
VNQVRERLLRSKPGALTSAGGLRVFSSCLNTIQEFQSWSFKRDARGELPPGDDRYEDDNNHLLDPIRGIVATSPKYTQQGITVIEMPNRR